jgi:hypothetical protein
MDWIDLAQDMDRCRALLNVTMNHRVPKHERQYLTSSGPIGFSRRTPLHTVSRLAKAYIICSAHLPMNNMEPQFMKVQLTLKLLIEPSKSQLN